MHPAAGTWLPIKNSADTEIALKEGKELSTKKQKKQITQMIRAYVRVAFYAADKDLLFALLTTNV